MKSDLSLSPQHYRKHVFICTNQKVPGKTCCANTGGVSYFDYFNRALKQHGINGPGEVRVSQSGCLGRCSLGPCLVIYPEGVWYTYTSFEDLDDIIEKHLLDV